jgi:hypothetical protein
MAFGIEVAIACVGDETGYGVKVSGQVSGGK